MNIYQGDNIESRVPTTIIIDALRTVSIEINSLDGVVPALLCQAANRLERLEMECEFSREQLKKHEVK